MKTVKQLFDIRLDFNVLADDIQGADIVRRSNVITFIFCDSTLTLIVKVEIALLSLYIFI